MKLVLIAHDSKKMLMQNFCIAYRGILIKHEVYATGTTGRLVEEAADIPVHKFLAGPLGGLQQVGAGIEANDFDLCIFLRDVQADGTKAQSLVKISNVCDTHNIPMATNLATAELLIKALDRGDLEWRELYR